MKTKTYEIGVDRVLKFDKKEELRHLGFRSSSTAIVLPYLQIR